GRNLAAGGLAILDPDRTRVAFRGVDVQAHHRAAGGRQVLDAKQLQPQRRYGRGEQRGDLVCLVGHRSFDRSEKTKTKRGPAGPFVQYRWIPAWPPAAGDHEAQASRKRKRLRGAFIATRQSVVAGAGFEPATFGL